MRGGGVMLCMFMKEMRETTRSISVTREKSKIKQDLRLPFFAAWAETNAANEENRQCTSDMYHHLWPGEEAGKRSFNSLMQAFRWFSEAMSSIVLPSPFL